MLDNKLPERLSDTMTLPCDLIKVIIGDIELVLGEIFIAVGLKS